MSVCVPGPLATQLGAGTGDGRSGLPTPGRGCANTSAKGVTSHLGKAIPSLSPRFGFLLLSFRALVLRDRASLDAVTGRASF